MEDWYLSNNNNFKPYISLNFTLKMHFTVYLYLSTFFTKKTILIHLFNEVHYHQAWIYLLKNIVKM